MEEQISEQQKKDEELIFKKVFSALIDENIKELDSEGIARTALSAVAQYCDREKIRIEYMFK